MRGRLLNLGLVPMLGLGMVWGVEMEGVAPVAAQTIDEQETEGRRLEEKGTQQYKTKDYAGAIQSLSQALVVYRSIQNRKSEGRVLVRLGLIYHTNLSQLDKAIDSYSQALGIFRELKNRDGELAALMGLAHACRLTYQYEKAISFYNQTLPILLEPSELQAKAFTLQGLGQTYTLLFQHENSIHFYNQALSISREIKDRGGEELSLNELGAVYRAQFQYSKSLIFHNQALSISREVKDRKGEARTLNNLGMTYDAMLFYEKASDFYNQSLLIYRATKDRHGEGKVLGNLGDNYRIQSQHKKALDFYTHSLEIFREFNDQNNEATVLNALGVVYDELSEYFMAIDYYNQALQIFRTVQDRQGEAQSLMNLGNIYQTISQHRKSFILYQQSFEIYRSIRDLRGQAGVTANLASLYIKASQPSKAIELYKQSLSFFRSIQDRKLEAVMLGNIGAAYSDISEYKTAINFHNQALLISRKIKNRDNEAIVLGGLGLTYRRLGQYEKSNNFYREALLIVEETKNRTDEGTFLNNLGNLLFIRKNSRDAEPILLKAMDIYESLRPGLTDDQRRSLSEDKMGTYRILQKVQVALQKVEPALETSERGRSRALVELLSARLAGESLDKTIAKQKVEKLTVLQIQQIAKNQNTTLVQYANVSDKELYIYITQPNGKISFRTADLNTIGQSVKQFVSISRNSIGARGRSDIERQLSPEALKQLQEERDRSLRQLHQLLIEPIADLLPKDPNQRVVFLPQGELFLVPFPALLNAQNQPLITQHTILTAPSIQTLDLTHKAAQALPKGNRPALVVGNPTMPAISTIIGDAPHKLKALPGAEKEAIAIAQQLNTQPIIGAKAKKDTIVQQMQTAGVIHFATHGLLDSFKGETPGAIALAPNGTGERNDGLLTSGELFDLKLNAELVVLSACDTGRGDITGDGVIGLSRSLFVAGVPSVIVSLWKVPDDSTAFLMTEFYRNWKDRKLDKAQALRQAMLTTRAKYPQPLDWAAFTLIGEAE
jgi:CHAT domain-containing protein